MVTVIHRKCGKPAFYFIKPLKVGDIIKISNIVKLNGNHPKSHYIICGSCKEHIPNINPDTVEIKSISWKDWFIKET